MKYEVSLSGCRAPSSASSSANVTAEVAEHVPNMVAHSMSMGSLGAQWGGHRGRGDTEGEGDFSVGERGGDNGLLFNRAAPTLLL